MKKTITAVVGRSDQNLSSALDSLPDLHVRFAPRNEHEYSLITDHEQGKGKRPVRRKSNPGHELDRQVSVMQSNIDQFEAARHGNLELLQVLFQEHEDNYQTFFNRLDPETKLTALHYATRFHHLHVCRFLVEQCHVDVNKAGEDGMTPLHYIARFRLEKDSQIDSFERVVRYLIQCGADINARDDFSSTPLHHACERNNVHCADILIQKNAFIEAQDRQQMRPLHGASFYGSVNTARLLIDRGANVLATDQTKSIPFAHACRNSHANILEMFFDESQPREQREEVLRATDIEGNTLLHLAVAAACVPIVDLLIGKQIDRTAKRDDGQTAIHLCAKNDSVEILEKLIEGDGDISVMDNENETILHKAAAHNREHVLKHVLSKKNDREFIQKRNTAGVTALLLAATFGHTNCVTLLLDSGADMFHDRDKRERGPVYLASMSNHVKTLEILLRHAQAHGGEEKEKLAVNEIDRYNRTGLHAAAELGFVEIVDQLLKSGASLTVKDDNEYTALMLSCKKNRIEVLKAFIAHINSSYKTARDKLNILEERDDGSNTALHIAAAEGHSAIIKLLLANNCDLQARNMISWLPIHCAADGGRFNSAKTLLESQSPIDPVDKNQQTPLHLAARNGHSDVVKLLLKNGAQIEKRTSTGDNCLDLAIGSNRHNVAEILVNHRDWAVILRNAKFDELSNRWDTPMRKLIRRMPDIALIVLDKCCSVIEPKKSEQGAVTADKEEKMSKKDKKKKSVGENIVELEEQMNSTANNEQAGDLTKDETQLQKLRFIFTYEFLDDQFSVKTWQGENKEECFEPEGILYPGMNDLTLDRKGLQLNHPFTLMVEKKREDLLDHPLVHSLLDYKWTLYARYVYYFNFLFYLLFVAALTSYVFVTFAPYRFGVTHDQMNEMTCSDLCSFVRQNHTEEIKNLSGRILTIHIFQWIVIVLASIQIIKELFQIVSQRLDYINLENAIELTAFILAIVFTVDLNSCSREIGYRCVVQWQAGALGVFLTWLALVLFIQKFPRFGIFVVMLTDILRTFSRFFLVFFLFIIGFALAFHMLLQNHNPFQHFGNSLLKTCVMMIGEFEYEGIFHGDNANYFGITYFFFIVFIVVMSIIIMNLLVGLAVDDIAGVMRIATVKRLEMRVQLTLDVERQLPRRKFFDSLRRFRTVNYRQPPWQKFLKKFFRIEMTTTFDKTFARLEDRGLIQTAGGRDSKNPAARNAAAMDDQLKSAGGAAGSMGTGSSSDWITAIHSQISSKYNDFNRHMTDLKTQQEKINNILQQFPLSTASRQDSHLTFAQTTA